MHKVSFGVCAWSIGPQLVSEVVTPPPFPSRTNSMAPTSVHPSTVLRAACQAAKIQL